VASIPIDIELHPKQGVALDSPATEILYGGAAGGGKSYLMRCVAILWCSMIPGLQCYLFRRLRDDLIKNHVEGPKGFRAMLAGWVNAGLCVMVEDEIRFWNGSKIYLCHCKDENSRFKYLGAEIHLLLIDELTTFTDVIYRFLRARVRMVGIILPAALVGRFPRILAASNPGNIGHHSVKAAFINGVAPLEIRRMSDAEGGMLRQYIPARLDDNPSMATDDPSYRAKLRGLGSEALVKAMEDGDWNVVAGAFFDCWSTERHVVRPFAIPVHWVKVGSFDWGSARPFSMQWWAVSDGSPLPDKRLYPTGAMILYRQWYGAQRTPDGATVPNTGLRLTVKDIAFGIKAREREKIDFRVADPACWKVDGGPSHAEVMNSHGVIFRRADNSRVTGWTQVRDRMMGDDDPMLYVFDTCSDFIRTVPALQHDDANPEDVDSDGEDHDGDAARYAAMARPWTRMANIPAEIRGADQMTMGEAWRLANPRQDGRRI
jgi:hypothetical protein